MMGMTIKGPFMPRYIIRFANGLPRCARWVLWLLCGLAAAAPPGFAQARKVLLERINYAENADVVRYVVVLSGKVRYTSVYSAASKKIRLFLRDAYLPAQAGKLLGPELKSKVSLQERSLKPPILQISFAVSEKLPYRVAASGNTLEMTIRKRGGGSTQPQPVVARKPAQRPAEKWRVRQRRQLQALGRGGQISIDFRNAEIGNVLRVLARQNGLNIVASDSVTGKITVSLRNVSMEQALESILHANGYKFLIENQIILVKPASAFNVHEMESRVFRLNHIDAHNLVKSISDLRSPEGKIKVLTTSFHNRDDVYEVNEKIQPSRQQKYWLRSSVVLVTDFPANLEAISRLVKELDKPVPQIMIEAKLVETSPRDNNSLGIDWSKSIAAELFDQIVLPGGDIYRYSTQSPIPNRSQSLNFGTLNTTQFNAVLNYLKSHMNTRLVSNPRILAMDNEPSDISVGTKFPIPQITRGVGGQGDIVTFLYRDIDIKLRVIPHVVDSSAILMYVNPVIEEVTGQVTVAENTAPITSKREVDTVVKVHNGDTIVIGGMIKEREVISISKVWLLGDIPLLGHLFRNKTTERQQTDLLIFITTNIVTN